MSYRFIFMFSEVRVNIQNLKDQALKSNVQAQLNCFGLGEIV